MKRRIKTSAPEETERTAKSPLLAAAISKSDAATASKTPKYEMRLVAFLDILGFKELVMDSTGDDKVLKKLLRAIRGMREEDAGIENDPLEHDKRVTQFSDSVVVSYKVTSQSSVFYLLLDLLMLVVETASRGVLLRGGISIGRLIHTEDVLLGPGMLFAYNLESKVAKHPRVIVDPQNMEFLLHAAGEYPASHHDADHETHYVSSLLTKDDDGNHFLDYISFDGVVGKAGAEDNSYPEYLALLGKLVLDGLKHHELSVREKYIWLHKKYAAQLKLIKGLEPDHFWRVKNPDLYLFYSALPDHEDLAKSALK